MQPSAQESYLVTKVMTATPQKLQLMLIDAAIRSCLRGRQKWEQGDEDGANDALVHAQHVVGELLAALNPEVDAALAKNAASVYLFIFRSLMEANTERNAKKLGDALRVLEVERETWRLVCEQLGGETPRATADDQTMHSAMQEAEPAAASSSSTGRANQDESHAHSSHGTAPPQSAAVGTRAGVAAAMTATDMPTESGFSLEA